MVGGDEASNAETSAGDLIETTVSVATWNLWWRFGPWEDRMPAILAVLRALDADVVALQEVWGADGTDAAAEIARELGGHVVFEPGFEMEPGVQFGNAVVSRWPIGGSEVRRLPAGDAPDELRLALRADIDGPRGPIQVFCTHLNWRFDQSQVRQAQVRELAAFVADSRPRRYPPVVCGDLNAEPQSAEVQMLTGQQTLAVDGLVLVDAWHAAHPTEPGFSWDDTNPFVADQLEWNRRIDYVLVGWPKARGAGNVLSAELVGTEPVGGVWPSDHFGVVAELRY